LVVVKNRHGRSGRGGDDTAFGSFDFREGSARYAAGSFRFVSVLGAERRHLLSSSCGLLDQGLGDLVREVQPPCSLRGLIEAPRVLFAKLIEQQFKNEVLETR